jgi:hypothetical protein
MLVKLGFLKNTVRKLLAFEGKILRKNYGPFKEIAPGGSEETMNYITSLVTEILLIFIRLQRLRWFGHVYRMNSERLVKGIYKWKPLRT